MLTQPPSCEGCPCKGKSTGFVLGQGDPKTARLQICLESPFKQEVGVFVEPDELERRKRAYPGIPESFLKRGLPAQGETGAILDYWILKHFGLSRGQVFLDNTIRCCLDMNKPSYPTGNVRKKAEAFCAKYNRWEGPTISLVGIHPAAISRDPAPLPMVMKTFEKGLDFGAQGEKVLILAGGKASSAWLGAYAANPTRLVGHYEVESGGTRERRVKRWEEGMKLSTEKKVKVVKLTVKRALAQLLAMFTPIEGSDMYEPKPAAMIADIDWVAMQTLLVTKPKKVKDANPT